MSHPLIVTERRILPRLIDSVLTLIAWGGFIWLIYHGVESILHTQSQDGAVPFKLTFDTVVFYLLIVLVNSLLLVLWAKYNQIRFSVERRTRRDELSDQQLAEHFGLKSDVLEQLKQSQIAVVSYSDDGSTLDVRVKQ